MKLSPEEFFKKYKYSAMLTQIFYGVPASITLAQAALESGWGGSGLTINANNFFGIKAHNWNGPTYDTVTDEFENGQYVSEDAKFRKYRTPFQSFKDHAKFLRENERYSSLFELPILDYSGWAYGLKSAGYATSPTYAIKLLGLIEQNNLQKYDSNSRIIKTTSILIILSIAIYFILMI